MFFLKGDFVAGVNSECTVSIVDFTRTVHLETVHLETPGAPWYKRIFQSANAERSQPTNDGPEERRKQNNESHS